MPTISLCMIVKNEEEVLARCLTSVAGLVDEIIIVDTGSTDRTRSIAEEFTDKVYDFAWIDDFAAARNFAFSKAGMDYCMWLDADDILREDDRERILELKRSIAPEVDVVMMRYHTAFDQDGTPIFSYYRERLIRNVHRPLWSGAVHEAVSPFGTVIYSEAAVTHQKAGRGDPDRNLRIFEKRVAEGVELVPREQFYYARELYYHQRYEDAVRVLEAFLAEGKGWVENQIEACRVLAYCRYALHEDRKALQALVGSLEYDKARAEACCEVGKHFLDRMEYRRAAFWYELALSCERDDSSGAFVTPDAYGYLPCIQLCVCWFYLGQKEKAQAYNERAGGYKPGDAAYLFNKALFANAS